MRPNERRQQILELLRQRERISVEELARMMVESDMELARREKTLRDAGHVLPAGSGHDQ